MSAAEAATDDNNNDNNNDNNKNDDEDDEDGEDDGKDDDEDEGEEGGQRERRRKTSQARRPGERAATGMPANRKLRRGGKGGRLADANIKFQTYDARSPIAPSRWA